jgi:hypothetical protein
MTGLASRGSLSAKIYACRADDTEWVRGSDCAVERSLSALRQPRDDSPELPLPRCSGGAQSPPVNAAEKAGVLQRVFYCGEDEEEKLPFPSSK